MLIPCVITVEVDLSGVPCLLDCDGYPAHWVLSAKWEVPSEICVVKSIPVVEGQPGSIPSSKPLCFHYNHVISNPK